MVAHARRAHGGGPLAAVGYSLGGNVLLKYLGETGPQSPFQAAAAVSVPLLFGSLLSSAAARLFEDL